MDTRSSELERCIYGTLDVGRKTCAGMKARSMFSSDGQALVQLRVLLTLMLVLLAMALDALDANGFYARQGRIQKDADVGPPMVVREQGDRGEAQGAVAGYEQLRGGEDDAASNDREKWMPDLTAVVDYVAPVAGVLRSREPTTRSSDSPVGGSK